MDKPAAPLKEALYMVAPDGRPTNAALHEALLADGAEDVPHEQRLAIARGMEPARAAILFQGQ